MCLVEQARQLIMLRHTSCDISELLEEKTSVAAANGYWKRKRFTF